LAAEAAVGAMVVVVVLRLLELVVVLEAHNPFVLLRLIPGVSCSVDCRRVFG
jgi:hypothetical protein